MAGAWVKPDEYVYATTITGLGRLHDADRALQVLGKMREAWVELWELTYNSMVGVLVKVGRMDEVLQLKDQMMRRLQPLARERVPQRMSPRRR